MSTLSSSRSVGLGRESARAVRLVLLDSQATAEDVRRILTEDFNRTPTVERHDPPVRTMTMLEAIRRFASSRLRVSPLLCLAAVFIGVGMTFTLNAVYIRAKAELAQILLDRAWETTLATHRPTKAWSWADTWPIARITFPRLNETAIVLDEAGGEALAFGPAHVAASPLPGANGVSIIGGHRDTHFTFIKDLKPGDEIKITTPEGKTITFRMTHSAIVHAGASGIATEGNTPRLALVTCYPFDGLRRGPLRYVVFAEETKHAN